MACQSLKVGIYRLKNTEIGDMKIQNYFINYALAIIKYVFKAVVINRLRFNIMN